MFLAQKTPKISTKKSKNRSDTVKGPYKFRYPNLWYRGSIFRTKFPCPVFPCVELVWIHATYTNIERNTQAARRFLRSACILMLLFQDWILTRTNAHVIQYLLTMYLWWRIFTCIVSILPNISHDIGIEISRTYSRYRYMDIFRKYRMIYREF